jgi:hypothetical protein
VTDWNYAPGKHLLVTAPEEGVKSLARVVYCQRVESTKFAVGLHLVVRVEEWGKPLVANHYPSRSPNMAILCGVGNKEFARSDIMLKTFASP